ncbi:hypothetical protein Godav_028852 [Gossypium davidsonii]|uniref:Uncharacterized protein n=1 Tax=Gossypium davidsonii TaxID=34287 RepID=A0A7J8TIB8_GOSDV|nr:hypothetical protein [Gossypium davidsonii]
MGKGKFLHHRQFTIPTLKIHLQQRHMQDYKK